jgi:drug/metabolite transporter (DMT)-like permease
MNGFPYYGELIAFTTTLSWSIGVFPFTEAARRLGPNPVNHFRLLLAVMLLTLIAFFAYSIPVNELFSMPLDDHWLWFGLSGIVGLTLGDYFGFTSFAILGTRVASIFSTLSPGAALLFGFLLLGERINMIGVTGMAITVGGVLWLILSKTEKSAIPDHGHGSISKGFIYGVLSAICQGVGIVLSKKGMSIPLNGSNILPVHATWLRMIVGTVTIYIITILAGRLREMNRPVLNNANNGLKYAVAGTIFGPVIGVSFSMYAVSIINASVAQTIFSLVPVCVLGLGFIFKGEKPSMSAVLGALVAIAGVVVLIWRNEIAAMF